MSDVDINYRSISDVTGYELHDERIDPEQDGRPRKEFADVLKFSCARDVQAKRLYVVGGHENAVDMNRHCARIEMEDCVLEGGDQAAIVIKGGSKDITLRRVSLVAVKGWCDVLLGDWSDQSYDVTTGVRLIDVSRRDGKPVRVVCGRAEVPTIVGGNVRVLRWASLCVKTYWWAKYIAVRFLLRKPPLAARL